MHGTATFLALSAGHEAPFDSRYEMAKRVAGRRTFKAVFATFTAWEFGGWAVRRQRGGLAPA